MQGKRAAIFSYSGNKVHVLATQFVRHYRFFHWHKVSSHRHYWYSWLLKVLLEISKGTTTPTWKSKERHVQELLIDVTPFAVLGGGGACLGLQVCFLPKLFLHILAVFALGVLIPCCFEGTNVFHGMSCVKWTNWEVNASDGWRAAFHKDFNKIDAKSTGKWKKDFWGSGSGQLKNKNFLSTS